MRDDATVMAAIVKRMDGTLTELVQEIRATHPQQSRLDNRETEFGQGAVMPA